MKKKKGRSSLEKTLNIGFKDEKISFDALLKKGNPDKVASLISKREKLAKKLENSGGAGLDEGRQQILKLKAVLSQLFEKNRSSLEKTLNIGPKKEKVDFNALLKEENPDGVTSLIAKHEKLADKLESSGEGGAEVIRGRVSKLKAVLSILFKRKQQELIYEHWKKVKEENERFLKEINKRLVKFRKKLKEEKTFKIKEK